MKLATIAIPTYNRVGSLRRAVGSALAQKHEPLEVVICDNASTDGTESFCRDIAARDNRVRYVRQPHNVGALANFESALAEATGVYFMWLADDDWLEPNYLTECVQALENGAHLAAGRAHWVDGNRDDAEAPMTLLAEDPTKRVRRFYWTVHKNSVFYGVSRTSSVRDLSPVRRSTGGDWLFVASSAFAGTVETIETTAIHRAGGGSSDTIKDRWSIPTTVVADVLKSPSYGELGTIRRTGLAIQCGAITGWRIWIRSPVLTCLRKYVGDARYSQARRLYRKVGRVRSRSEIVSVGVDGQPIASDASSQRIPPDAAAT